LSQEKRGLGREKYRPVSWVSVTSDVSFCQIDRVCYGDVDYFWYVFSYFLLKNVMNTLDLNSKLNWHSYERIPNRNFALEVVLRFSGNEFYRSSA